jgi:trigger factor
MQISVESLSAVKKKLDFEIPADRVATEFDKVFDEIRKKASIKGFRKGKVPRALIEKHYSDVMEQDVIKNIVNDTYFKALADEKIFPVSYPLIEKEEFRKGECFRYSVVVEVIPDIKVKDYDGLEVSKELYLYDEEVINSRLREMQESLARLKPVDSAHHAASGDFVTFDFEGFIDGVPFENGKGSDYQLELGSGSFIPGFEEQLIGMSPGDEGEIAVAFPADYGKGELAGRDAVFKIHIKDIKVKELPELDDELAGQFGEFETLDQLKAHLRDMQEKQEMERIDSAVREGVVTALIEKNPIEVPESLIDQQAEQMLENANKRLAYQRLTLEMMGLDEEKYKIQFRPVAESQVKGSLLLDALAKQENIEAGEEDFAEKFRQMSGDNEKSLETVRNYYLQNQKAKENLLHQIKEDKAVDFLLSRAKITEVAPEKGKQ